MWVIYHPVLYTRCRSCKLVETIEADQADLQPAFDRLVSDYQFKHLIGVKVKAGSRPEVIWGPGEQLAAKLWEGERVMEAGNDSEWVEEICNYLVGYTTPLLSATD